MMITVKKIQKAFAIITFMAILLPCQYLSALNSAFTDCPIQKLTVLEIDVRTETVILQSSDGETAVLSVGDVVGLENFEITAICKKGVNLEGPPDNSGRKEKNFIPAVPISAINEFVPIHNVAPAAGN